MKSALIFQQLDEPLWYLLADGDWSEFRDVIINNSGTNDEMYELGKKLYKDGTSELLADRVTLTEWCKAVQEGAIVVPCGFF